MLRYALQTLAARKASFVGAFVALACAAALVTACGTLLETGLRGDIDTERYAAAPVVVAGDQDVHHDEDDGDETKHKAKPINERVWLPADLVDRIADAPGVRAAVPEMSFPAAVAAPGTGTFAAGPDDRPSLGHAWGSAVLAPLTIDAGAAPTADDEIVVDRGLASRAGVAVGDRVTVQATGAPTEYRVVGIATTSSTPSGGLEQQSAIFFSEDEARRLAGHPDEVAVIGVLPEAGVTTGELTQQVEAALDGTTAQVHRDDLGAVEFLDASQARVELISMGGALAGTGIVVATLVVVGTFALAIQQRERELALLRAIAATPRQVRRLIGREALLVGTAAGLPGAAAGWLLAGWLYERFVDLGTIPETMAIVRSPFPVIGAVAATLLTAWLAARISARRAARIRPAEALSEAAAEPARLPVGRLLAGALVLAGAVVILLVLRALHTEPAAMPVTYLVVLVLAIALALLGPLVARVAATVSGVGLRALPVTGHLAAKNGRANARRLATVVTPIALLVGMACTVVFIQTTLGDAAARQAGEGVTADWVIGSSGPGVPADAVDRLRRTPGVVAVTEMVHTTVRSPGLAEYTVQGVTPRGLSSTVDLGVTDGSLDALDADGVAISEVVADSTGLRPGDGMDLVMGDGTPVDLTVVAVYERALGFGDLTMAHDLVAEHVDNPVSDAVLVTTDADADEDDLRHELAGVPGVELVDGGHVADQQAEAHQENAEVTYVGMGLILAFTAVAATNTLAMSTADRSRELALLRLVGMTRRQVLRMLRLEAVTAVVTAVVVGTVISLVTLTAFAVGMTGEASPSFSLPTYLLIVALAATLALVATAVPGRVALRAHPADTITAPQ